MKKLCLFVLSLFLLFAACRKENIDEIIIEEFVFKADTLLEKDGTFILIKEGDTIVNDIGYAFMCKGFHGDTVNFRFSNDLGFSSIYPNSIGSATDVPSSILLTEENGKQIGNFHITILEERNPVFYGHYFSNDPVTINKLEVKENYVKMEFTGSFNVFEQGESLPFGVFSGVVEVPLYQNCEIGRPIPQAKSNSKISIPYNLPVAIKAYHISCDSNGIRKQLISSVPATFEQLKTDPNSLLQNENDFYFQWSHKRYEFPIVNDFQGKMKINIPPFEGIVDFVPQYTDPEIVGKTLFFGGTTDEIHVLMQSILQDPITERVFGEGSFICKPKVNRLESCN